jgi:hypothetical protein
MKTLTMESISRKKTTQNPTPPSQPPMQRKKLTPPPNKMRVLQHNCQKKPECIYSLLETATTMNFDIVLIQEPPMGLRGKKYPPAPLLFTNLNQTPFSMTDQHEYGLLSTRLLSEKSMY